MTRDQIISAAQNLPQLVQLAKASDPVLAQKLVGTSVAASKSLWGGMVTLAVSELVAKYGLGWPPAVCEMVGGLATAIALAGIHWYENCVLRVDAPPTDQAKSP